MKFSKKIGLFLSLPMIFGMVGCGPTSDPTSAPSNNPTSVDPTTSEDQPTSNDPTSEFVSANYISLIGTFNDWSSDVDFVTEDGGLTWTLSNYELNVGDAFKIRENHDWIKSWNYNNIVTTNVELEHIEPNSNHNIGITVHGYYSFSLDYVKEEITVNLDEEIVDHPTTFDVNFTVSNVADGKLEGVAFIIDEVDMGTTNADGSFKINSLTSESVIRVKKDGYITKTIKNLSSSGDFAVDLEKDFAKVGALESRKWPNFEAFTVYVTRSSTALHVRHVANNTNFTSEGRNSSLETYISIGENTTSRDGNAGVTQIVVLSDKSSSVNNYGGATISDVETSVTVDTNTYVDIYVPFSSLGIANNAILGISAGVFSHVDSDWSPMCALDTTSPAVVENPSAYVRCDVHNEVFISSINDYPPAISYDKDALIAGKPFNTGNPTLTKMANADDIYFSVEARENSFFFDMVGFGTFEDSEYIKFVFHTSDTDGSGWGIQSDDLSVLVSKTTAKCKTGLTDFWGYTNFGGDDKATTHQPTYELKDSGYFTLTWELNYDEIPSYTKDCEVSFIAIEFGNGVIYNNDPWVNAMLHNGNPVGDPAAQTSYVVIQEKKLSVDKDTLLKDYTIQFSSSCHAKFDRTNDGLKLSLVLFTSFADTHFVRFIVDTDGTPVTSLWGLDKNDVSFVIFKDKAYIETNNTDFWAGQANQFHASNIETLNSVEYNQTEEYIQMSLLIDWSELGLNINSNSALKGLLLLFNPEIQNHGFNYNGQTNVGDQAYQTNYFTI